MVIAIFEDERAGAGISCISIVESDEGVTVRYQLKPYQTATIKMNSSTMDSSKSFGAIIEDDQNLADVADRSSKTYFFSFLVVPRSDKEVKVEEKFYTGMRNWEWRERKVFAKPDSKE